MFFSNLHFTNVNIQSKIRKHKISLHLEVFTNILDLIHDRPHFKPNEQEEGNNFNYKSVASSFMLNPKSKAFSLFIIGYVHHDICLIYYEANHILFPRKNNFSHLTRYDVASVCLLANNIETNQAGAVIQYMLENKRKGICLPYGDLVAKVLS